VATPVAVFAGARWDKWFYAGLLIVLGLLSLTGLADANTGVKVVGVLAAALLFVSAARAPRWGRIEVFADHVAVRSLWRIRRFPWRDVQRFVVEERPVLGGPLPARHRTLGVHLLSGQTVWAPSANASSREATPTWVDRAAAALNERLSTAWVSD